MDTLFRQRVYFKFDQSSSLPVYPLEWEETVHLGLSRELYRLSKKVWSFVTKRVGWKQGIYPILFF